jgi:hypothetical protein
MLLASLTACCNIRFSRANTGEIQIPDSFNLFKQAADF